ncbi:unnamed protein product [Adineta steineri]|uniref:G-protein coupled receptors family 1 profile domain-containing protein n=1 Tax=Adineta steineri TaxID=433720 RepID=A0A815JAK0_9BILA|nr:unnamed protein product [Adineta steineri]CAF1374163.1 unnamed protein product [Adineta steineri]CAF1454146.1 unnamed protein product [Adineta steineri]
MSLTYRNSRFNLYGSYFFLITGTIGNFLNILIFSSERNYRRTPSTFYFLIGSIHNIFYIVFNLTIRIYNLYNETNLVDTSLGWCLTYTFLIGYLGLTSFTCSCLATIDQFFATSRNAYLRQYSNIKWAHRIVFIIIIVWFLHAIPVLLFYNVPPITSRCNSVNKVYQNYIPVYILVLQCGIPVLVMLIFGGLTYRNMCLSKALVEQHADRQLTKMIIIQVILVIISMTPFGILEIYTLITSKSIKSTDQLQQEAFAQTILILVSYIYYVGNFYMFIISSNRFRQALKNRISFWKKPNQINP